MIDSITEVVEHIKADPLTEDQQFYVFKSGNKFYFGRKEFIFGSTERFYELEITERVAKTIAGTLIGPNQDRVDYHSWELN